MNKDQIASKAPKIKRLNKLGKRNYLLVSSGVRAIGSFDPEQIIPYFEEQLRINEIQEIEDFLTWVHENNKQFGRANYEAVFAEYKGE